MKHKNQMPTFWLLLISTIFFTILALLTQKSLYKNYHANLKEEPLLAIVMQGIGDRVYPEFSFKSDILMETKEPVIMDTPMTFAEEESASETQSADVVTVSGSNITPKPETYSYVTSDLHYFDDALFIGDSRTVGLHDYSNMKSADFYAKVSSTIYEIMDDPMIEVAQSEQSYYGNTIISIRQALEKRHFGKIYMNLILKKTS